MSSTERMAGVGFRNRVSESASGQMALPDRNEERASTRRSGWGGSARCYSNPAAVQMCRFRGSAVGKYTRGNRQVMARDAARVHELIE